MNEKVTARVSARTDVGNHREHNEDNFLVADLTARVRHLPDEGNAVGKHGLLFAVCDGMGGAAAGEVASDMAVESLFAEMVAGATGVATGREEFWARLETAAKNASAKIHEDAVQNPSRQGMGTTFTAAGVIDDHVLFAHVGDSRAYLLRADVLTQVTRDQSLLAKLLESGELKPEEADTFEHGNIILQALGASADVVVEVTYVQLRRADRLLLCSDGLSGLVPADEIAGILGAQAEPTRICIELIERAKELGGDDNVTAIVVFFDGEGLGTQPTPIVVRQCGPDPALPPIPDPRNLGRLLNAAAAAASQEESPEAPATEPEPEAEPELAALDQVIPGPPRTPRSDGPRRISIHSSEPPPSSARPLVSAAPSLSQVPEPRGSKAWIGAAAILALAVIGGSALYVMSDLRKGGGPGPVTSATATAGGVSTWTSVESNGSGPAPVGSEPRGGAGTTTAPFRAPNTGASARPDLPVARPPASARPTSAAATGSARKGELAPLRDDPPE